MIWEITEAWIGGMLVSYKRWQVRMQQLFLYVILFWSLNSLNSVQTFKENSNSLGKQQSKPPRLDQVHVLIHFRFRSHVGAPEWIVHPL